MAIAPPPNRPVAVHPGRRPQGSKVGEANTAAAKTMVGVLLAFKAVTITLILLMTQADGLAVAMVVAMNWIWLIVLGFLLSAIPLTFWWRLLRARARRSRLKKAEWVVD